MRANILFSSVWLQNGQFDKLRCVSPVAKFHDAERKYWLRYYLLTLNLFVYQDIYYNITIDISIYRDIYSYAYIYWLFLFVFAPQCAWKISLLKCSLREAHLKYSNVDFLFRLSWFPCMHAHTYIIRTMCMCVWGGWKVGGPGESNCCILYAAGSFGVRSCGFTSNSNEWHNEIGLTTLYVLCISSSWSTWKYPVHVGKINSA